MCVRLTLASTSAAGTETYRATASRADSNPLLGRYPLYLLDVTDLMRASVIFSDGDRLPKIVGSPVLTMQVVVRDNAQVTLERLQLTDGERNQLFVRIG